MDGQMVLSPWPEALPDCPFGIFPFSFCHDAPKAARAFGTSVKPLKKRPGAESIPKAAAIAGQISWAGSFTTRRQPGPGRTVLRVKLVNRFGYIFRVAFFLPIKAVNENESYILRI